MKYTLRLFLFLLASFTVVACSSDTNKADAQDDSTQIIGVNTKEEPKITYCLPRYISEDQSRSLYELFTGKEATYGHLILRTQPKIREGLYFFVMFGYAPDKIGLACKFVLEVDSNKDPLPRTFVFDVPETASVFREVKLGITGTDWSGKSEKVNAWRLTLLSPTGKIITQTQSWLWSVKYSDVKKETQKKSK